MKTRKKVLIALLTVSCMAAGAVGLAACDDGELRDPALSGLYNTYVEQNGDSAKSYGDWLKDLLDTVGTPGSTGEQGPQGIQGLPGKPGDNGLSAYEIYSNAVLEQGGEPLSEAAWLASLSGANGDNGVGIRSVEMTEDGKGLLITYDNNTTATVPLPEEFTHVHTYDGTYVTVLPATENSDGLAYMTCASESCGHIELLALKTPNGDGSQYNQYTLKDKLNIGESATYVFTSASDSGWWGTDWNNVYLSLEPASAVEKYKITINSEYASSNVNGEVVNTLTKVVTKDGDNNSVEFNVDPPASYDDIGEFVFTVTIERVEAPQAGSMELPLEITADTVVEFEADENEEVYYAFKANMANYRFEIDGVSLTWMGTNMYSYDDDTVLVDSDELRFGGSWGPTTYYFMASSATGEGSFKITPFIADGEQDKPIELELGESYTTKVDYSKSIYSTWYEFKVTKAGYYTVETTDGNPNFEISNSDKDVVASGSNAKIVINLEEGTYVIKASNPCTFKVREADDTDAGYYKGGPKTATLGKVMPEGYEYTYYKYVADKAGYLVIEPNVSETGGYCAYVYAYSDAEYSNLLFNSTSSAKYVLLEEGDAVYFRGAIGYSGNAEDKYLSLTMYEKDVKVDYVVTVKGDDDHVFSNLAVTAKDEEGETVATGTTDENGKVTFNVAPGNYSIEFELEGEDYEYKTAVTTPVSFTDTEVDVTVNKLYTYEFTVKFGEEVFENVSVTVNGVTVETDENGKATIKTNFVNNASVSLSGLPEGYEYANVVRLESDKTSYDVVLSKAPVAIDFGESLEIKAGERYTFTMPNSGTVTISVEGESYLKTFSMLSRYGATSAVVTDGKLSSMAHYMDVDVDNCEEDSDGNCTKLVINPGWSSAGFTVIFEADADTTISITKE